MGFWMKKILMLGASELQVPAIKRLKEYGWYVIACDYNPEAVGFEFVDESIVVSTQDKEAILDVAKTYNVAHIMTSTSDAPVRTAAFVSEKMGLTYGLTYENALCATIKSYMRKRFEEREVPIPIYYVCNNELDFIDATNKFTDKFVVKPSDNAASRGVLCVDLSNDNNLHDIYGYVVKNSKNGVILVEEYMDGPEVSVECVIIDSQVYVIAITDKLVCELPYFVEIGHSEPSQLSDDILDEIKQIAVKAVKAIGIVNGVSHVEIKVTKTGVKVVEAAARLGGDNITSDLVPLSTGVNMIDVSVRLELGMTVNVNSSINRGSAIRYIKGKTGTVKALSGIEHITDNPNVVRCKVYDDVIGKTFDELKSSNDRLGYIITVGRSASEAINVADEMVNSISVEYV